MDLIEKTRPSKVPRVTVFFWIIKILATTLGETAGDTLSMQFNLGYLASTGILFVVFVAIVAAQIGARSFHRFLYWAVIVATTTVGTTLADFADRSLGIGYVGGSLVLFGLVVASLGVWWLSVGTVSVTNIATPKAETFYWVTILFSNTLGTALGDFTSDDLGLGFHGSAVLFAGALAVLAAVYFWARLSRTLLFWAAFILTRPLGATLGDSLTKPVSDGGLNLSRLVASTVIAIVIVICILFTSRQAGRHPTVALPE